MNLSSVEKILLKLNSAQKRILRDTPDGQEIPILSFNNPNSEFVNEWNLKVEDIEKQYNLIQLNFKKWAKLNKDFLGDDNATDLIEQCMTKYQRYLQELKSLISQAAKKHVSASIDVYKINASNLHNTLLNILEKIEKGLLYLEKTALSTESDSDSSFSESESYPNNIPKKEPIPTNISKPEPTPKKQTTPNSGIPNPIPKIPNPPNNQTGPPVNDVPTTTGDPVRQINTTDNTKKKEQKIPIQLGALDKPVAASLDYFYNNFFPFTYFKYPVSVTAQTSVDKRHLPYILFLPENPEVGIGGTKNVNEKIPDLGAASKLLVDNPINYVISQLNIINTTKPKGIVDGVYNWIKYYVKQNTEPIDQLRDDIGLNYHNVLVDTFKDKHKVQSQTKPSSYMLPYLSFHMFTIFFSRIIGIWPLDDLNIIYPIYENQNDSSEMGKESFYQNSCFGQNNTGMKPSIKERYRISIFNHFFIMSRLTFMCTQNQPQFTAPFFKWLYTSEIKSPNQMQQLKNTNELSQYTLYSNSNSAVLQYLNPYDRNQESIKETYTNEGLEVYIKNIKNWNYYNTSFFYTNPFFGQFNNLFYEESLNYWTNEPPSSKKKDYLMLNWLGVIFSISNPIKTKDVYIQEGENTQFFTFGDQRENNNYSACIKYFKLFDIPLFIDKNTKKPQYQSLIVPKRLFFDQEFDVFRPRNPKVNEPLTLLHPIPRIHIYNAQGFRFHEIFTGFSFCARNNIDTTPKDFYKNFYQISKNPVKDLIVRNGIKNYAELADMFISFRSNYYCNEIKVGGRNYPRLEYIKKTIVTYVMPFLTIFNFIEGNIPNTCQRWKKAFNALPESQALNLKIGKNRFENGIIYIIKEIIPEQNNNLTQEEASQLFSLALWMAAQGEILLFNNSLITATEEFNFNTLETIFDFGALLMETRAKKQDIFKLSEKIHEEIKDQEDQEGEEDVISKDQEYQDILSIKEIDDWFNSGGLKEEDTNIHFVPIFPEEGDDI